MSTTTARLNAAGRFPGTIREAYADVSANGTPRIVCLIDTPEGSIIGDIYLTEKTKDRVRELLAGLDVPFDRNAAAALQGKEVSITTAFESDDKGQPRLRVKWINPPGGGRREPTPGADDAVAAFFGGAPVRPTAKPATPPPRPPAKPAAPAAEDDDQIPF
jgi:hypothetical protein